ncbi:ATP-binding protein [Streptomyces mexicanus]|uniref:ATP-binding protein n=1 Tax=Streptomyces mexicanus TaxID=178566 RepID=A0A7X1LSS6_9ACTN|nr:ATP-binding protein [Streptomyces mexicanus]MBC2868418.1 ATP-binding protein [Streptomyces mexicanus]
MTTVTDGQPNAEDGPAGRTPTALAGPPGIPGVDTATGSAGAAGQAGDVASEPLRLRSTVPADPSWASAVRRLVTAHLAGLRLPADQCDSAVLATDELFANAVKHASTDPRDTVTLTVEWSGCTLRVTVADSSPVLPRRRAADAAAESGRGLAIVAAIADDWGMAPPEPGRRGKRVWFTLRGRSAR